MTERYHARRTSKHVGGRRVGEGDDRRGLDIGTGDRVPVGPGEPTSFDPTTIDFGHYAGRTVAELATEDPDYLRWLARHPSGARYRVEIERVFRAAVPRAGDWER